MAYMSDFFSICPRKLALLDHLRRKRRPARALALGDALCEPEATKEHALLNSKLHRPLADRMSTFGVSDDTMHRELAHCPTVIRSRRLPEPVHFTVAGY